MVFLTLFQREQFIKSSEDRPAHIVGAVKFDIQLVKQGIEQGPLGLVHFLGRIFSIVVVHIGVLGCFPLFGAFGFAPGLVGGGGSLSVDQRPLSLDARPVGQSEAGQTRRAVDAVRQSHAFAIFGG